jgi:hypothetical protein
MRTAVAPIRNRTGEANAPIIPLSVIAQNCNSLNLTGSTVNFDLKLAAVLQSRADIILLSDTRVITSKGVSASQRIENCLRDCKFRRYKAVFNSTGNSRGVAIFIASDLSYVIHGKIRDMLELSNYRYRNQHNKIWYWSHLWTK